MRRRGVVVQAGLHVGKASTDPMLWALKDITIEATWCYPITMWPRIIGLVESGKLPIAKIIDGRIRAEDVVSKGFDVLTGAEQRQAENTGFDAALIAARTGVQRRADAGAASLKNATGNTAPDYMGG